MQGSTSESSLLPWGKCVWNFSSGWSKSKRNKNKQLEQLLNMTSYVSAFIKYTWNICPRLTPEEGQRSECRVGHTVQEAVVCEDSVSCWRGHAWRTGYMTIRTLKAREYFILSATFRTKIHLVRLKTRWLGLSFCVLYPGDWWRTLSYVFSTSNTSPLP